MKVQTNQLSGMALDYAVAIAQGYTDIGWYMPTRHNDRGHIEVRFNPSVKWRDRYDPTQNWFYGGPIIEREWISIYHVGVSYWKADRAGLDLGVGSTALEAAMRCYVSFKLGDSVEIPFVTVPEEQNG